MAKVYVLGAGVDAAEGIGMPLSNELLPRITAFLETESGKQIDDILRSIYPQLRFRFDAFIEKAIDNMARNFNDEVVTIRTRVAQELDTNHHLTQEQQNMGQLIVRMMEKVNNMATGAQLDEETERLIRAVFADFVVRDNSIIDLDKIVFTETFQMVVRMLMKQSLSKPNDPILQHMNRNFLDIEKLLMQYFIGFFLRKKYDIKIYSYIAWMLWAYLLTCEQDILQAKTPDELQLLPVYSQIEADATIINFNYTTFGRMFVDNHCGNEVFYFHGSLLDYLDIKRKQDFQHDLASFKDLDIPQFFEDTLCFNVSFDDADERFTIPSFMPPVSIKPVLSQKNIRDWYKSYEALIIADRIIIIGYSFNSSDEHFNGMLRDCCNIPIFIIDHNVEAIKNMLRPVLGIRPEDYSTTRVQNHESFQYNNVKIVNAHANEIDYTRL